MRWKNPKSGNYCGKGDTRIRKVFLLFPKCIKEEWRWLEYAKWVEEYRPHGDLTPGLRDWVAIEWINK